jgi:hypothetical protein
MLKTLLVSAAISGLMISGSLAQQTSTPGNAPATSASGNAPKFVATQAPDQWVFSKFKGTDVVGPNDESIGGVNDMLFDKSGKIVGVIVGVGGFLGIGQKSVAIDMSAFQVVPAISGNASASNDPSDIKLRVAWTKEQLQQAPDFRYFKPPSGSAANGTRPALPTTGMGQQRPSPPLPSPQ